MKLSELITPEDISARLTAGDKLGVLKELVGLLGRRRPGLDTDGMLKTLLERERLGSTGTGEGVAIPHGKADSISELMICFGKSETGIDFDAMDGKPVHLFFLLVAPTDSIGTHLSALARISNLLNNESVRRDLLEAEGVDAIHDLIRKGDENSDLGA
jgi:nitrogen PTS system EIIA component